MLLDIRNRVHIERIYKGSLNASTVRVGDVRRPSDKLGQIPVVHTPAETRRPARKTSPARAIVQAGKLLDINVLDFLISGGAVTFR